MLRLPYLPYCTNPPYLPCTIALYPHCASAVYRVAHLVVHLGWVDLEFESSTVLPNCPAAPAKFPSAQAELGRQWNTQN